MATLFHVLHSKLSIVKEFGYHLFLALDCNPLKIITHTLVHEHFALCWPAINMHVKLLLQLCMCVVVT